MNSLIRWTTQCLADVPVHNDWLTSGELDVLRSRTILKRRADWRLGRWTAKQALLARDVQRDSGSDYADIEIRAAEDGAPEVLLRGAPAPVTISLSHSHGVAMCAVTPDGVPVGCDTEAIEARSDALIADYFAASERDRVRSAPRGQRDLVTTLIWSAKESVLKAMREGLRRDPRDVVIELTEADSPNGWATFAARDQRTGAVYDGWWRVEGQYVYTVARPFPGRRTERRRT
jgi:4'-phosphopantetheinyl transferase